MSDLEMATDRADPPIELPNPPDVSAPAPPAAQFLERVELLELENITLKLANMARSHADLSKERDAFVLKLQGKYPGLSEIGPEGQIVRAEKKS